MTHKSRRARLVAAATVAALVVVGFAAGASTTASADQQHGTSGLPLRGGKLPAPSTIHNSAPRSVTASHVNGEPGGALPAGVPATGSHAFLLQLSQRSTSAAYHAAVGRGKAAAHVAAKSQLSTVTSAQNRVIGALPSGSRVLYRTHAVLAGVAVVTDVKNYSKLTRLSGVSAVYPIAPKSPSNSYAVPLQKAPQAWESHGNLGQNSTVAIIDTGIDYTHTDLGGDGAPSTYPTAKAAKGQSPDYPNAKVIGGYDLAGDDYNADPTDPNYQPVPSPDPWPLDCNGHGSHVAGTVAGFGVNKADGSRYAGPYDTSTPFDSLKIGPGMAPHAKLYGYRVFGCQGSTDLVSDAIDMAADPNGDGDTSDHVDVVNLSLGSDYGSPQDGDSVMTEAASALGITMVVASGNAGDLYDVGGSPGDAPSALTVAASQDAYAQVDTLTLSAPGSIAGDYAAERSTAYDWSTKPDLSGDVVALSDPNNADGCLALSPADAAAVAGKVAFLEWTDNDATRRCGSATRADHLATAGAVGFVFGDDQENFGSGILGNALIPGVLVAKSGADAIRAELTAGHTVSISGTTANGFAQNIPGLNDTLANFSSRGIGDAGNVKPDVTAVGATVFSTASGTGTEGVTESGTSMATPMVAGTAALVKTAHPDWSPKQTKADIMNTAGQDLFTAQNHSGTTYAPQRVGSGRIDVQQAVDNDVLAYVADDGGAVSASFGPQAVTEPTTLTKTIKVQNTGLTTRAYNVSFDNRTTVPGATYAVSPSSIVVDPRSSVSVTLTLTLDPSAMTKTHDGTVALTPSGLPRQFQADASGLVQLTAIGGGPDLRVPAYAAPRPASAMTQPDSVTLPAGSVQQALLPLSGQSVDQGSGSTAIQSTLAGFELQGRSGLAPDCSDTVTTGCVHFPDERSADLRMVGATSDAPQRTAIGQDPMTDGFAYFAINTHGRWRTASTPQEFDIYIDGNGDGTADAVLFNTRIANTDLLVSELYDLHSGDIVDIEGLNMSLGNTDTAMFDSDTLVLPVAIAAIPGISAGHSRISYSVLSYSAYGTGPVDQLGDVDEHNQLVDPRSIDVLHPGLALYGTYTGGSTNPLLYPDSPASVLTLRRDSAAYAQDGGLGAMVVHFHNALGEKTQVVKLKDTATVGLSLAPNPASRGGQVTATVTVPDSAGTKATGPVVLKQGATTLASGTVADGTAQLTFSMNTAGSFPVHAEYAGDDTHLAGVSPTVTLQVAKTAPTVALTLSRTTVRPGRWIAGTVQITTVAGVPATGRVKIRRPNGRVLAVGTLTNGTARLAWKSRLRHSYNVRAVYVGDTNYLDGRSGLVHVTVKRR
ncbi:MAG TPA: S8 family serine peptidase [Marmoricola sp.]|nr:S8 family serine peptidase [Marmoricola sp.]